MPWQHPGKQQASRLSPCPGRWQEHGRPLKIPPSASRAVPGQETPRGAAYGDGPMLAPCENAGPPPGQRLLTPPGQPLGWHTRIASHATHAAVRAPSSTDGRRILARDSAMAPTPCHSQAPVLEEPGLQETCPPPAPYSIARTRLSDTPLPCAPKQSGSLPPHLPPMQVLLLPSPWKSQQRQSVTARSTRLHLGLSQLGLTYESNIIANSGAALGLSGSPGWSLAFP